MTEFEFLTCFVNCFYDKKQPENIKTNFEKHELLMLKKIIYYIKNKNTNFPDSSFEEINQFTI
jgi:hypothetical protein